ncbi:MAG TPA: PIN domain-containing protein [Candidatus Paceibacterota bacterium]|nr:PIN domain-containing protein [Candidatus Paceibacterota bacterium]
MGSKSCVIDSSVFVAFYRDIDALHTDALRIMQELSEYTLVVHPYVIQETATVLTYGAGLSVARQFLVDITAASNIVIPAIGIQNDIRLFLDISSRLSFTDVALIGLAKEMGIPLITFDRQMLALSKKFV